MKKQTFISKCITFLLGLLIFTIGGCTMKNKDNIVKIGAILPLSGSNAMYGKWIKEGLELKREEINRKVGGDNIKVEIIYEDDKAQPTFAVNALNKLISVDKISIVFGSWASSSVLAEAPIAEKNKVIVMAEAISPKIRDAGDYIFRIQPDARYYLKKLVPYVFDNLKLRKIAILYVNNDFGVDQKDIFSNIFTELGGKITMIEAFKQGDIDFRTQLLKIKKTHPDGIFIPAYIESGYIVKQAKELGIVAQLIGSVPFENPDILSIAKETANGVIYPHHFDAYSEDSIVKSYQKMYKEKYGMDSEGFAALAFDGLGVLYDVITKCSSNTECIKNELYKVSYKGVTGIIKFDNKGDVISNVIIKEVMAGKFVKK